MEPTNERSFVRDSSLVSADLEDLATAARFLTIDADNDLAHMAMGTCCVMPLSHHHQKFIQHVQLDKVADSDNSPESRTVPRYCLDLSKLPLSEDGWAIGPGYYRRNIETKGVDLILPGRPGQEHRLPPVIAIISIHHDSGAIMIEAVSHACPIEYLSDTGLCLHQGEKTVLWRTSNLIRFAKLQFTLDVIINPQFQGARDKYLREEHSAVPSPHLDLVPLKVHYKHHNYIMHSNIVGRGTSGRVYAGVNALTGSPVAIKVVSVKLDEDIKHMLKEECRINKKLQHPHVVCVEAAWCRHSFSEPCFEGDFEDLHMAMPLAETQFEKFFHKSRPQVQRLKLFGQVLQGLAYLHTMGIMHRDIKLSNLLVFRREHTMDDSPDSWYACISDFGRATDSDQSDERRIGTAGSVAPEVWWPRSYNNAIDIYALGYAHLQVVLGHVSLDNTKTDHKRHKMLMTELNKCNVLPVEKEYIRWLMSWDPNARPSAEQALLHPLWKEPADEMQGIASGGGDGDAGTAPVSGMPDTEPWFNS